MLLRLMIAKMLCARVGCVCDVMVQGQLLTNKYRRVSSVGAFDKMQNKVVCVCMCVCVWIVCVCGQKAAPDE